MMASTSDSPERPLVVVIAEDEPLLRTVAVGFLEEAGFVTLEAENAAAALDLFRSHAQGIDVLFTDIRMPGGMDGLELAHRVRQRWPWIAIIISSGNIFVTRDQLPEGACFLPKPYDMDQIIDVIRERRRLH
jgi:CheY-like chemotaxis protein